MKITIMICNATAEVVWNAFRLANIMLEGMDDVTIFLNGPSVDYAALDSERFPINELAKIFTLSEGRLLA
ncbi:MAG TPA: sulfur reduction protein DsrE [Desulfobulbaceae bacterium]|nr:sulfur reduction protein DsrE [Desulfobulbaceae bacterium]